MERLLEYFTPAHYIIDLNIDKAAKLLAATTIIEGSANTETIKLHARTLDISSVTINDQPVNFEINDDVITATSPQTGDITIKITYTHQLNANMQGVYLSTYNYNGQTETIVATQFESHYARECFPCIDEPAAKATFNLTITTDPADTVISNMPIKNQENGTTTFDTTPKMSTYLLAFVIGKLKKHTTATKNNVEVTTYASLYQPDENLIYATEFAAKSLDFYDDLFQTPYPLPKLDQVAIPDFEAGAMENWGLVTYREQALLCCQSSALDQKLYVSLVIAHELSHMWFGDLVTMAWWDDLWLNESFASLMETYATDKISPDLGAWNDFYSGTIVPALRRDCLPGVQPVKCEVKDPAEIPTLFDGAIVYAKGARLMLMLMRLMSENNFFSGLTDYFKKHAYQNTVSDDLWDALSPHADFNIKEFMTPWLIQPGYPALTGQDQHRFLLAGNSSEPSYTYPIPVVKDDLSGHYLINLEDHEFQTVLNDFDSKSIEQKLRLLYDRQLLSKTPLAKSADLIPLLNKFPTETEFIIWDALLFIIADLKIFFSPHTSSDQQFKNFIKTLVRAQFDRLGLTSLPNESINDTKLRPIILGLMTFSDDPAYQVTVTEQFGNTSISEIDSNIRTAILATLTKLNDNRSINHQLDHQNLIRLYQTSPDPELRSDLLSALAAIKNPDLAATFLSYLQDGTIRPGDRILFFIRLLRNPTATPLVLDWFYKNWDWLNEAEGDKTISDYPRYIANIIRTSSDAIRFKDFFQPKLNNPVLSRTLEIAFAEIEARLDLIVTDGPDVIAAITK
ncbi:M1 family metallopeptidase [Candidatus Saccharibacteria bacterium]|nr:M1 family metallopeptidase [Candidatus Saccharibacteria bacterium]